MSSYVLNLLGYLASKTLQERYVIEGTTKEYIVLEQLVEDAYYFTKHPITLMRGYDTLKLKLVLDNLNIDEGASDHEVINSNVSWAELKTEAKNMLHLAGAHLAAFELREVKELSECDLTISRNRTA